VPLAHKDPADRFLAATAQVLRLTLVTADADLLGLGEISTLANRWWENEAVYLTSGRTKAGGSRVDLPAPALWNSTPETRDFLQLLEELAAWAGNVYPARDAAFAVFHALDDAGGLAALGAIRALGCVHDLLAVGCFCDLGAYCHGGCLLMIRMDAQRVRLFLERTIVDGMSPKLSPGTAGIHSGRFLLRLDFLPSQLILQ
jgi:hypothetical protein